MIIEFIGMIGVGKTTLHQEAVQRLKAHGRTVWTPRTLGALCGRGRFARLQRLGYRARASWWSCALMVIAVRHLSRGGRLWRDRLKALRCFLTSLGNWWKAHQTLPPDGIALIDEGVSSRMFTILVHDTGEVDLAAVRMYARAQPLPDVLVYLTASPEVAIERAVNRSKKLPLRFRSLTRRQLSAMYANTRRALDVLVDEIRTSASYPVHVVVIQAEDLDAAKRALADHLDAILTVSDGPREQHRRPAALMAYAPMPSPEQP